MCQRRRKRKEQEKALATEGHGNARKQSRMRERRTAKKHQIPSPVQSSTSRMRSSMLVLPSVRFRVIPWQMLYAYSSLAVKMPLIPPAISNHPRPVRQAHWPYKSSAPELAEGCPALVNPPCNRQLRECGVPCLFFLPWDSVLFRGKCFMLILPWR